MRTIGRRRPANSPSGDFETICSYCGIGYLRSDLRRDRAGFLACADDFGGDVVTISEKNAAGAQRPLVRTSPIDGAGWDHSDDPDPSNPNPPAYPPIP